MAVKRRRLGDVLKEAGILDDKDIENILQKQNEYKDKGQYLKFGEVLVKENYITKSELLRSLSKQLDIDLINISKDDVDLQLVSLIGKDFIEENLVAPIKKEGEKIIVATNNPVNHYLKNDIEIKSKMKVEWVLTSEQNLIDTINKISNNNIKQDINKHAQELVDEIKNTDQDNEEEVRQIAKESKVVRMVDEIITEAIIQGASDIHIEPINEKQIIIRYRIDGILIEQQRFPSTIYPPLISRIKITSNLDISKKRVPQDGRVSFKSNNKEVDLRVSTNPTINGEKVVIRILDKQAQSLEIDDLGFTEENKEIYKRLINKAHGMILLTGPTGSGKTTTLYSGLKTLDKTSKNISTIEDPVEYEIDGIGQSQVNRQVGYTFNTALETLLRQDPDIMMVGEIRDLESCKMAVDGAETGHLVLSTLHTNTSAKAVTRLLNMGVEPYLIASALEGVLAQRLVRTICKSCKVEVQTDEEYKDIIEQETIWEGEGCIECNDTGYKGRSAIHEILLMNDTIENLIVKNATANEIEQELKKEGFESMQQDGIKKVKEGITTLEEILRVTNL